MGFGLFRVTLVNPKCAANVLDESLCFLAQSYFFFHTGKTHFYITGDIQSNLGVLKTLDTSFFFPSIKRFHPLSEKGNSFCSPKF